MRRCYRCGAKMKTDFIVCPECEKKIEANRRTIKKYNYICGKIDELKAIRAEIEGYKANYPVWDEALDKAIKVVDKHMKGDPE